MGSDSKEKQYEKKVKDYTNSLKSKVSSLKPENAFESAKETLEEVLPMFIWLRSEGKDLKRVEKITKNEIKVNDDETLSDEDNDKLNKAVESLKTKTAFATFDKYIFKDSLLKLSVMTNGEPKLTDGNKYILKLHKDCYWLRLYVLFKDDPNKVDLREFDLISKVINIILKEEDKYLKSRHLGFGLTKVKLRKLIILESKKYFIKLDKSIEELVKNRKKEEAVARQNKEIAEAEEKIKNSTPDEKSIPNYFKLLKNVNNVEKFNEALSALLSVNGGNFNFEEQVKDWKVEKQFNMFPCFKEDYLERVCIRIRKHLKDNCKKKFKEVADEATRFQEEDSKKRVEVSAWINGKKRDAYVEKTTTTNDLLDFVQKELKCSKIEDMFLAAKLREDIPLPSLIPKKVAKYVPHEGGQILKVPETFLFIFTLDMNKVKEMFGNETASGFGKMADLYVFDKNHKGQWDKIKGSEDLPKPEAEPVKKNSSSSKITPPSEEKKKDPKSSNSTKKTDDTKKNEELKKELDELTQSKADKEAELIELNQEIEELKIKRENAKTCLENDASKCGKDWDNKTGWDKKGLIGWESYYKEGKIGWTDWALGKGISAKGRLEQVQKEIANQKKIIEDCDEKCNDLDKDIEQLNNKIKDIDRKIEDVNKKLKK